MLTGRPQAGHFHSAPVDTVHGPATAVRLSVNDREIVQSIFRLAARRTTAAKERGCGVAAPVGEKCSAFLEGGQQPDAFDYAEGHDASVTEALSRFAEHARLPSGNFQSMPDFRVFVDRDLFLVKPVGKRFWLRSAALADANAITLDLPAAAGQRHDIRLGCA